MADRLSCPHCNKEFVGSLNNGGLRSNFQRHLLTHSGERPYTCSHCDASFTTSTNLKRHVSKRHSQPDDAAVASLPTTPLEENGDEREVGKDRSVAQFECRHAGCGKVFTWMATRTLHERRCALKPSQLTAAAATANADTEAERPATAGGCAAKVLGATVLYNDSSTTTVQCSAAVTSHEESLFVPPLTFTCMDCEAVVASRQKLKRHMAFHCPFRERADITPEFDLFTPTSAPSPTFPTHLGVFDGDCVTLKKREREIDSDSDDDEQNDENVLQSSSERGIIRFAHCDPEKPTAAADRSLTTVKAMHPCPNCCKFFARKRYLAQHSKHCTASEQPLRQGSFHNVEVPVKRVESHEDAPSIPTMMRDGNDGGGDDDATSMDEMIYSFS